MDGNNNMKNLEAKAKEDKATQAKAKDAVKASGDAKVAAKLALVALFEQGQEKQGAYKDALKEEKNAKKATKASKSQRDAVFADIVKSSMDGRPFSLDDLTKANEEVARMEGLEKTASQERLTKEVDYRFHDSKVVIPQMNKLETAWENHSKNMAALNVATFCVLSGQCDQLEEEINSRSEVSVQAMIKMIRDTHQQQAQNVAAKKAKMKEERDEGIADNTTSAKKAKTTSD